MKNKITKRNLQENYKLHYATAEKCEINSDVMNTLNAKAIK